MLIILSVQFNSVTYIQITVQPISKSRSFWQTETLCPLKKQLPIPLFPPGPGNHYSTILSMNLTILGN